VAARARAPRADGLHGLAFNGPSRAAATSDGLDSRAAGQVMLIGGAPRWRVARTPRPSAPPARTNAHVTMGADRYAYTHPHPDSPTAASVDRKRRD
jgi:hypothetical protein